MRAFVATLVFFAGLPLYAAQTSPTTAKGHGSPASASEDAAPASPFDCDSSPWRLDGADWQFGSESTFREKWSPILKAVAACALQRGEERACVTVQGQFDNVKAEAGVARAFGSSEAVQSTRARGRASIVASKLHDLGVPPDQIREMPPPGEPSWRGVEITLIHDCLAVVSAVGRTSIPPELTELRPEAQAQPKPPPAPAQVVPVVVDRGPTLPGQFRLEAALDGDGTLGGEDPSVSSIIRGGVGWHLDRIYAHASLGATVTSVQAERWGAELALGGGYQLRDWLEVGGFASFRTSSNQAFAGWLERSGYLGVESSQCWQLPTYHISACAREALAPVGYRRRRAISVGGRVIGIPEAGDFQARLDLGLLVRKEL